MAKAQISREAYEKYVAELHQLETVGRDEVAARIAEARSQGDLSENAEYDEAMNDQAAMEAEILKLKSIIENAEIIDESKISVEEIGIGSVITVRRLDTGKEESMKIVSTMEADFKKRKISDESPIGKAAMKKKVGDIFIVDAPVGELQFEVLSISK